MLDGSGFAQETSVAPSVERFAIKVSNRIKFIKHVPLFVAAAYHTFMTVDFAPLLQSIECCLGKIDSPIAFDLRSELRGNQAGTATDFENPPWGEAPNPSDPTIDPLPHGRRGGRLRARLAGATWRR